MYSVQTTESVDGKQLLMMNGGSGDTPSEEVVPLGTGVTSVSRPGLLRQHFKTKPSRTLMWNCQ